MVIEKIVKCLERVGIILDGKEDIKENIFEYGLDSLGYIHLICEIEKLFQIEVSDEYLINDDILTLDMLEKMVNASL